MENTNVTEKNKKRVAQSAKLKIAVLVLLISITILTSNPQTISAYTGKTNSISNFLSTIYSVLFHGTANYERQYVQQAHAETTVNTYLPPPAKFQNVPGARQIAVNPGVTIDQNAFNALQQQVNTLQMQFGSFSNSQQTVQNVLVLDTAGGNLLRNSSFEAGGLGSVPSQWNTQLDSTSANTFISNEGIHSGSYGLKFLGGGTGNFGISQPNTKTVPQRTYTLSGWVKNVNAANATIRIGFWDEQNNKEGSFKNISISGTRDWYRISTTVNTPGQITDLKNWFPMFEVQGLTSGNVYMDDVQLTEGSVLTDYNTAQATSGSSSSTLGDGSILGSTGGDLYPAQSGVGQLGTSSNRWSALNLSKATIDGNGNLNLSGGLTIGSLGSGIAHISSSGGVTSSTVNLASSDVTGLLPVGNISGTLPVGNGGTGLSSTPTNGQLLIGNGTGYSLATLTAGSNVTITNASGTITIASTAGGGGTAFSSITGGTNTSAAMVVGSGSTLSATGTGTITATGADVTGSGASNTLSLGTSNANNVTIGNSTGATQINVTSGTGAQTYTSSATTGTAFALTGNSVTTGTGIAGTFNGLTTGTGLSVSSSNASQTSATLLSIAQTGVTTGFTGNEVNISGTSTTGAGNIVNIADNALNGSGTALNVNSSTTGALNTGLAYFNASAAHTGNVVNINSASTAGTGLTITDSASGQTTTTLLNVAQTGVTTGFTGNMANFSGTSTTGTGNIVNISSANTTNGNALAVTANSATTGNAVNITANGLNGAGSGLVVSSSTTNSMSNGLAYFNASAAHTGNVVGINSAGTAATGLSITDSASGQTTQTLLSIAQTGVTTGFTGNEINISGTSTTGAGNIVNIADNALNGSGTALNVNSSTTGALNTGLAYFNASAAHTGNVVNINSAGTTATGLTITDSAAAQTTETLLNIASSGYTTGYTGNVVNISGTGTTGAGNVVNIVDNGLNGSGTALTVSSSSTGAFNNGLAYFNGSGAHTGTVVGVNTATATGTGLTVTANSLTTGTGLSVSSSNSGQTSATLLSIGQTGVTTGFTGNEVNITGTSTTGAGNIVNIADNALNGSGTALNVNSSTTGALNTGLAYFNASAAHTGNVVNINSAGTTATGLTITDSAAAQTTETLLNIASSGYTTGYTGNVVNITGTGTTGAGNVVNIADNALNGSGTALNVNSTTTGALNNGLAYFNASAAHTGNAVGINTGTATGNGLQITANALSSGNGLSITSNSTAAASNTQTLLNIALSGTNGTSAQTTYGAQISNAHAGTTSTNVGLLVSATNGTTANYGLVVTNGATGLGTSTPGWKLHVSDSPTSTASAMIENTAANNQVGHTGLIVRLGSAGSATNATPSDRFVQYMRGDGYVQGSVQGNGATGVSFSTTGGDLAEWFTQVIGVSLEEGDVISLVGKDGQTATKSSKAYDTSLLGVYSAHPAFVGGTPGPNKMIVGLIGQLPVKVSTENGAIQVGDPLTSSATKPGFAMKATKQGPIIGKALESYTGSGDGKINVYVNANYDDAGVTEQLALTPSKAVAGASTTASEQSSNQSLDLNVLGKLSTIGGLSVGQDTEFKGNSLFDKLADFISSVIFRSDVNFLGRTTFNKDTAGRAIIKKGANAVYVSFQKEYDQLPEVNISITLAKIDDQNAQTALEQAILNGDIKYIVTSQTTKGFVIELNKTAPNNITFSWTAIAVKDANVNTSPDSNTNSVTPTPTQAPAISPTSTPALTPTITPSVTTTPSVSPTPAASHSTLRDEPSGSDSKSSASPTPSVLAIPTLSVTPTVSSAPSVTPSPTTSH